MSDVLVGKGITKTFDDGRQSLLVLQGIDLTIAAGERVCVFGRSGSGKSTLLHILAGLLDADAGEVWVDGTNLTECSSKERAELRNRALGFVYQFHHLLPEFTALENVAMPLLIRGDSTKTATSKAEQTLCEIELQDRMEHLPKQLSGGERLRVAVARAVVGDPQVVLADEPTGSLDADSARRVMELIESVSETLGTAFVIVSHDEASGAFAHRTVRLSEGHIVNDA
ncbi:MAG: ABC transporter ATP-binding protein [Gammaproteobacteria bacterium]|nr:ABC transporter ATP-binding protein [Gammaproteobacteria bacterium]